MSEQDDGITEDEVFSGNSVSIDDITNEDFDVLESEVAAEDAEQILGDPNV